MRWIKAHVFELTLLACVIGFITYKAVNATIEEDTPVVEADYIKPEVLEQCSVIFQSIYDRCFMITDTPEQFCECMLPKQPMIGV